MSILPSLKPAQDAFIISTLDISNRVGCVISKFSDSISHPFSSVTVTEYVPVGRLLKSSEFEPFDHKYVYCPNPPETSMSKLPVLSL